MEAEWGFLLIDARIAFKKSNHMVMLSINGRQERFCFNCSQHHALLVNHGETGNLVTISSYDGETQGDPFTMNGDGAGTIKSEVPAAKQRWLIIFCLEAFRHPCAV